MMVNKQRLIDADEAKGLFEDIPPFIGMTGKCVQEMLDSVPTVDAAPVVHGRWIAVPSSDMMTGKAYKCSQCNKMRYGSYHPNYCQCCGAKMDLEEYDG